MRTVALYAQSKTFNLAGLVGSYHIIYNSYLRDRVMAAASKAHYNEMNVLSMHALIGAYRPEGQAWVDELVQVLGQNVDWACSYIAEHFEGVRVSKPEGTYMLFLDCTEWCAAHGRDVDWLLETAWRVGVDYQDGRPFTTDRTYSHEPRAAARARSGSLRTARPLRVQRVGGSDRIRFKVRARYDSEPFFGLNPSAALRYVLRCCPRKGLMTVWCAKMHSMNSNPLILR